MLFLFLVCFPKLHGCGLLLHGQNFEVVVFFFMGFSKVSKVVFFFLVVPLKPIFFFSLDFSKAPKAIVSLWFFPNRHRCGLLLHGRNFKVVVFFFMVFSKVSKVVFFFLVIPLKPIFFFSLDFSKAPKANVSLWFFPKLHGCGLLVLLLVIGQHAHCLIQLFDYFQL